MTDVALIETGNGGDLQLSGNDLAYVNGIENMPYILNFGGNPGFPTMSQIPGVFNYDFWGNNLFHKDLPEVQFNSLVENELKKVSLNSAGRIDIENTFKKDLSVFSAIATIEVVAVIISDDVLKVTIKIFQNSGEYFVRIVEFKKKLDGDFVFADFNDDFFVG